MNRLLFKIILLVVIIICSSCGKTASQNNNSNDTKKNKFDDDALKKVIYMYGKKDYSEYYGERNLIQPTIKDNKQLLAAINYKEAGNDFIVDYFKYDCSDDSYEKYKTILKDDKVDVSTVRSVIYDEKNNMVYAETEELNEKRNMYIYDINNNSSKSLCVNDYIGDEECEFPKNIQLINGDNIAYNGKKCLLLYEVKNEVISIYDISNYVTVNEDIIEICYTDLCDNYLDAYVEKCAEDGAIRIDVLRIDTTKNELVSNQTLKTEEVFLKGNYVFFRENNKNYMIDRKTLDNKREIPCTEGMRFAALDIYDDFLYAAVDGEGIYKINLKEEKKEKIYEIKNTDINGFMPEMNILSDNKGFCVGCYGDEHLDELRYIKYIWFDLK